jgi:hypothetical protein
MYFVPLSSSLLEKGEKTLKHIPHLLGRDPCLGKLGVWRSIGKTYRIAIGQFLEADSEAVSKSDKPARETVGTIVSGVTYRSILPTIPEIDPYKRVKSTSTRFMYK